jgi:hypothetical protein
MLIASVADDNMLQIWGLRKDIFYNDSLKDLCENITEEEAKEAAQMH